MSTKIIKLRDNNDNVLLPVSDASAVQYNDSGSKISVQTAIDERIKHAIYLGTCTTAAATNPKVCTVETFPLNGDVPVDGTIICVKFSNSDTSTSTTPTINVNNTGAKRIYYNDALLTTAKSTLQHGYANRYIYYLYDSSLDSGNGAWVWLGCGVDTNSTYNVMTLAAFNTGTETTGRTLTAVRLREILATTTADWDEDDSTALSYIKNKPSFTEAAAITDTKLKYDTLSVNGSTTITDPNLTSMGLSNPVEVTPDWANYLVLN